MKKLLFLLIFIFSWFLLTGSTLDVGSWNCSKISGSGVYDSKCIGYVNGNLKVIYKGQTKNKKPSGKGILIIPDWPGDYLEGTWKNGNLIDGVSFLNGGKIFFKNGKMINKPSSKKSKSSEKNRGAKSGILSPIFGLLSFFVVYIIVHVPCNILYRSTQNSLARFGIIVGGIIVYVFLLSATHNFIGFEIGTDGGRPRFFGESR